MAIRIRKVRGVTVALCAAETDEKNGDIYLDDNIHQALAIKFAQDWQGQIINWKHIEDWQIMDREKIRDAEKELTNWQQNNIF